MNAREMMTASAGAYSQPQVCLLAGAAVLSTIIICHEMLQGTLHATKCYSPSAQIHACHGPLHVAATVLAQGAVVSDGRWLATLIAGTFPVLQQQNPEASATPAIPTCVPPVGNCQYTW